MTVKLKGAQQRTYDSIFAHPISHNLSWRDLRPLFESLGSVLEEPNGNVTFTRNGHVLVIHPETLNHNANPSKLVEIRHFLRSSSSEEPLPMPSGEHLLVVINHHEANVYKSELHGSEPQRITPYDPHGFERHIHNMHDHAKGQHHPVPNSFFEAVSKTLQGAKQILIFGTATGGESAMQELVTYLHDKHKDLFEHIIGAVTIDETHLTENQILSRAREFYASKWAPVRVAVAN